MLEPFREIRLPDVIDIVLVTALLYTAVVWIRRTQAALVAAGMLILGVLSILAHVLELRLTAWIFQGFFAIFLVMIVVIFQEELRQLFERVALWGLRRPNAAPPRADPTDTVVRCVLEFARDRIGALLVLPGHQPIERHIQGGIELNGKVSVPLLKSLFDPHSPGHDGAVIIEGGLISRFAVHLPLSKDAGQLSGVGTRHSAALGLAELTDALCLVVSEERGRMSIAQDGHLREVANAQELTARLAGFSREQAPDASRWSAGLRLVRANWVEKAASLIFVLGLWYAFVPGARPAELSYRVPVAVVNVPPGMVVDLIEPKEVHTTLRGPRRAFYLFDPRKLRATIDAGNAQPGRRVVPISRENIRYPSELSLEEIQPPRVRLVIRKADPVAADSGDGGAPAAR